MLPNYIKPIKENEIFKFNVKDDFIVLKTENDDKISINLQNFKELKEIIKKLYNIEIQTFSEMFEYIYGEKPLLNKEKLYMMLFNELKRNIEFSNDINLTTLLEDKEKENLIFERVDKLLTNNMKEKELHELVNNIYQNNCILEFVNSIFDNENNELKFTDYQSYNNYKEMINRNAFYPNIKTEVTWDNKNNTVYILKNNSLILNKNDYGYKKMIEKILKNYLEKYSETNFNIYINDIDNISIYFNNYDKNLKDNFTFVTLINNKKINIEKNFPAVTLTIDDIKNLKNYKVSENDPNLIYYKEILKDYYLVPNDYLKQLLRMNPEDIDLKSINNFKINYQELIKTLNKNIKTLTGNKLERTDVKKELKDAKFEISVDT